MVSNMVELHNSVALHKRDSVCELIGRQARDRQSLMWALIVLGYE
jgi:hypothetical protein